MKRTEPLTLWLIPWCMVVALASCHNSESGSARDKNTLVVAIESPPTVLDPLKATDAYSQRLSDLIFSSLTKTGPDLKPAPEVATEWKVEKDRIVFKIRTDLRFHSGRALTLEDIIYSVEAYKTKSAVASSFSAIQKVEKSGTNGLILFLSRPDATLLTNLALLKIMPRETVEDGSLARHPIGSGPYRFTSQDDTMVVLSRFEGPSHAKGKMEKIIFKIVRDDNTRYLKMLKGDIDIIPNALPEDKIKELKKERGVSVIVSPGLNFNYLLLNLKDKNLQTTKFRLALFSALDRDEIVNYKLENLATTATSMLAPANPFAAPHLGLPLMRLEAGKELVRELKLNGKEFVLKTSSDDTAISNGKILARQMERLGIVINQQSFEWGTFYNDVKNGRFQVALMRWVGVFDPDHYRDVLSSSEFPPGRNRGYYSNKSFDALVLKGREEFDFEKRREIYFKAQQMVINDMPIIPLWYNANIHVLSQRVKNFVPSLTGSFEPFIDVSKD